MYHFIYLLITFTLLMISHPGFSGEQEDQPRSPADISVGLTLSGGGARGLAHAGVLHVLDSLGVRIDFITGTSMGSIAGGMYASGYSAEEIEEFALEMNWEAMFARSSDLGYIHPARKEDHRKFFLEVPVAHRKIQLRTGAIEGQQLWNTLNEVFLHVHTVDDFNQLDIPFACVATNVETGEPVVMKDGNLITAIRASMAIPSVFTTVERNGMKLIDGGVVNNFPVVEAKNMGADFVIGVNVSQGLRPAEELTNPIDIIYQMGFYSDAKSFKQNREATDLYIEPDLTGYTAASFQNTAEIIEQGKIAARKMIDQLLELPRKEHVREGNIAEQREQMQITVDSLQFNGLENVRAWFARNSMNIIPGDTITSSELTRGINRLFATGYFERVHYNLQPAANSNGVILVVNLEERPFSSLAAAVHFSSFSGVGLIGRVGSERLFTYNAMGELVILAGENPAFKSRLLFYTSDRRRSWFNLINEGRIINFPLYEDFEAIAEYRQRHFRSELSFNSVSGEHGYFSLGSGFSFRGLSPKMRGRITLEGNIRSFDAFARYKLNSLNRNSFPTSGQFIELSASYHFNQKPRLKTFRLDGQDATLEDMGIEIGNFLRAKINWESYVPLSESLSQLFKFQLGYNFDYNQGFINNFNVGGTQAFLDNQVTFWGLNEYELMTESVFTGQIGYQYHIGRGLYASAITNAALYDFRLDRPEEISSENLVYGGALSMGYDSLIGPFELTFAYSPQTHRITGYLNLGWAF